MANEVKIKAGGQFIFADHAGDFSPTANTSLVQSGSTSVELELTGLTDTAGRESNKQDLGATRAARYSVTASLEFATAPTTGDVVEFYWAPSPDPSAANGNPAGILGVDAAAPSGDASITLVELVAQCQFIGTFVCTADAGPIIQTAYVGIFSPSERYGILVVKNESAVTMETDDVEIHISMTEILDEIQ